MDKKLFVIVLKDVWKMEARGEHLSDPESVHERKKRK